jgi:hypothetical protein
MAWMAPPCGIAMCQGGSCEASTEGSHPWINPSPSASIWPRAFSKFTALMRRGARSSAVSCGGRRSRRSSSGLGRALWEWKLAQVLTLGRGGSVCSATRSG